jgi:small-conductance mechanosensitive channel
MKKALFLLLIACIAGMLTRAWAQDVPAVQAIKKAYPFSLDTLVEANRITDVAIAKAQGIIADTASYLNPYKGYESLLATNTFLIPKDSIYADYSQIPLSGFEEIGHFWVDYSAKLEDLKNQTSDYISRISQLVPELTLLRQRWIATRVPGDDSVAISEAILENIDNYTRQIEFTNKRLNVYLDAFVRLNARISRHAKQVEIAKARFDEIVADKAKSVFSKDSYALFEAIAKDTSSVANVFKKGWAIERAEFGAFMQEKYLKMLLHAAYTLLLMLLIFLMVKKVTRHYQPIEGKIEIFHAVIAHPVLSALIIGLFSTRLFYTGLPVLYTNILILIGALPVTILLPKILQRRMPLLLTFLLSLIAFSVVVGLLRNDVTYERLALFISALLTLAGMLYALLRRKSRESIKSAGGSFILFFIYLFSFLLLVSIVANLAGLSQLGLILAVGVIYSFTTGLIAFVAVKITQAVLKLLIHAQIAQVLNSIRNNIQTIETWIVYLTTIAGVVFWSKNVFVSFKVFSTIQDAYQEFVAKSWQFGEVSLSIQNIIDFVFIVFVFYLIANIIHLIIQDEILPRYNLRRGLPLGMAILTRYVIMFLGFVLAMSAAGISLSKLNLIIGALGVGIGFGLQNIVSNIVSGFVIIFERPIHIGDIVTSGSIEGQVTAIGLRSSRIKTYDGAEVIVPNNNLTANEVANWTYSDNIRREIRFILVEGDNNPRLVKQIIDNVVQAHPEVARKEDSVANFMGYENRALKFRVLIWSGLDYVRITSEVLLNLHDALSSNGFKPYMPAQKVILESNAQSASGKIIGEIKGDQAEAHDY